MKSILWFPFFVISALGLTMEPEVPNEELLMTTGGDLSIKCTSTAPISWDIKTLLLSKEAAHNITNSSEDGIHTSEYLIKNATYLYTGSYTCYADEEDIEMEKSIYIYVKDVDHPLAIREESAHVDGYIGEPVIIPCKPTSPDINVTLCLRQDDECGDPGELSYDPKYGFTLKRVGLQFGQKYDCSSYGSGGLGRSDKTHSLTSKQVYLMLHTSTNLTKPFIPMPDGQVISTEDFKIDCWLRQQIATHYTLNWLTCAPPSDCKQQRTRKKCQVPPTCVIELCNKNNTSQRICYERSYSRVMFKVTLIIRKVAKSDEKEYICLAQNDRMLTKSSYNLKVIDANSSYLNLSMDTTNVVTQLGDKEAKWSVIIQAYPRPNITWYNPRGQQMIHGKYEIDSLKAHESKVKIKDLTVDDSGVYRIVANNREFMRELSVNLFVKAIPELRFSSERYYSVNENVVLNVEVTGYPLPELSCGFIYRNSSFDNYPIDNNLSYKHPSGVKCNYTLHFTAEEMGNVSCIAKNNLATVESNAPIVITDINGDFDIWGPTLDVITSDNVTIGCGVSVTFYYENLEWSVDNEETSLDNSSDIIITTKRTDFSFQSFLNIRNIKLQNSGNYTCKAKSISNHKVFETKTYYIEVKDMIKPAIIGEAHEEIQLNIGETFVADCKVTGIPLPNVTWYKDGMVMKMDDPLIKLKDNTTLEIPKLLEENTGVYKCEAKSRAGSVSKEFELVVSQSFNWRLSITLSCVFVIVLAMLLCCKCLYDRKLHRRQKKDVLSNFTKGQIDSLNPELNIHDQADLLPYDEKWEFPRDKLKLGKQLGSGAFGVVLKAEAFGLNNSEDPMIVAVKMVKKNSNFALIKALTCELKLMANLGQHLNVVNLIGACTKNIHYGELLVLVEYCRYGNLHNYLLRHRDAFINQINPKTGIIEMVTRDKVLELAYFSGPSNCMKTNDSHGSDYSNLQTGNTEMTSLSTPIGDDGYLVSKEPEWRSYYQGDYKVNNVRPICTQDLLCWSYQVARGMEYLASRKVLHGDLAARNILLAEGNVVKICDFGLARSMYSGNYCKKGDDPLPVKWMSIEALRDRIFSTQSDIWAFGIVLWEMFALAKTPYPGIQFGSKFFNRLLEGYRMEKPEYATDDIYKLMQDCWLELPMSRPSFTECAERIGNMLEESVKQHYMDLNDPYLKLNEQMPTQSDYLSMLNAPTFVNFSSVNGCIYPDGYVNMRKNPTEVGDVLEMKPMLDDGNNQSLEIKSFFNPGYEGFSSIKENTYMNVSQQPAVKV